jgi:hypothetical protein
MVQQRQADFCCGELQRQKFLTGKWNGGILELTNEQSFI